MPLIIEHTKFFLDSGGHYRGMTGQVQPGYDAGGALFNMAQNAVQLIQAVVSQHQLAPALGAVLDLHRRPEAL